MIRTTLSRSVKEWLTLTLVFAYSTAMTTIAQERPGVAPVPPRHR
jgi:hypothetical protein